MLAGVLAAKHSEKSYDRLVVVAPPATMGDLRAVFPAELRTKVIGEVTEDLTHVPNDKIGPYLDGVLVV